jgi:hypothetical protein
VSRSLDLFCGLYSYFGIWDWESFGGVMRGLFLIGVLVTVGLERGWLY